MNHYLKLCILLASLLCLITGCKNSTKPTLKVAATSVPHAELLEFVKPDLKDQDIDLEIIVIDDYNTPNRALADREVDANFFQHLPFLEAQQTDFNYRLESVAAIHLEPMGLYSKKYHSLTDVPNGATVAIPSDPSNQSRALELLEQVGWITLNNKETKTGLWDITSNPHQFHFIEVDSPLLSRSLDDVDAAAITTNFALLANLSPQKDALALENAQSRFSNLLVVREGESSREDIQALKAALTTDKVKQFMQQHYKGAIIPAFK